MACESQFPAQLQALCVLALIRKTRDGVSLQIAKEWLWVAGCAMETFTPSELPPTSEVQSELPFTEALFAKLDELESVVTEFNVQADPAKPAGIPWQIIVPIAMQILQMLLNKYLPTPAPVPPTPPKV